MIESQVCSMSDEKDFGFEETKSTILEYFELFKEARSAVGLILFISVLQILLFVGLANIANDETIAVEDKIRAMVGVYSFALAGFISTPIIFYKLIYTSIWKGKKLQKQLSEIQNNFIRKSYLTNFELVEPEIVIKESDEKLEKFVNHLSMVFPDIDRVNSKRIRKKKKAEQYFQHNRKLHWLKKYYFSVNTPLGWYVAQSFENKVTIEDIKKIIRKLSLEKTFTKFGIVGVLKVQRIIILGKEFDESVSEDNIVIAMNELKREFKIDIILETEYGYSTIWID